MSTTGYDVKIVGGRRVVIWNTSSRNQDRERSDIETIVTQHTRFLLYSNQQDNSVSIRDVQKPDEFEERVENERSIARAENERSIARVASPAPGWGFGHAQVIISS